jgi:hypothetical protein
MALDSMYIVKPAEPQVREIYVTDCEDKVQDAT